MNRILVFALVLTGFSGFSQIYQPIAFPEVVDKKYIFDPVKDQEKFKKKIRSSLPKKHAEIFSSICAYGKTESFSSGEVYLSWAEMEKYVNGILDSVLPASLASKKIKAYVCRSPEINAYCLYDGTMFLNVGLLAEVKTEAALAAIMGHELQHYIKNHLISNYKKSLDDRDGKNLKKTFDVMSFSQANELEADKKGFDIARDAHYNLQDAISNFEMFIREDEYNKKRNKSSMASTDSVTVNTKAGKMTANTLEKLLRSHPDHKERIDQLNAYIKANPQTTKVSSKFGNTLFARLQEQARKECIALLFNENNYKECLERAFLYHLYSPDDLTYQFYVAEATRRVCLMHYDLKKKGFLAEKLTNEGFNEGESILHDLHYLVPNPEAYSAIKATALLDKKPVFGTYKEAFNYFTQKLIDKNYQEAYLMRALFENNKEKINTNIAKYLASDKAKHKDYAQAYKNNRLNEIIAANTKEVVLIPRVNYYVNTLVTTGMIVGNSVTDFKRSEVTGTELTDAFAENFNSSLEDIQCISLPQAAKQNFNTKNRNETALNRTLLAKRDENEGYQVVHYYKELEDEDYENKVDIFRLDPETWELFKSYGIRSINYASFTRHKSLASKRLKNTMLYLAIPTLGMTLFYVPFLKVNYKMLSFYSYDARFGALYFDYKIQKHGLSAGRARKMYSRMLRDRDRYIEEYNEKYKK